MSNDKRVTSGKNAPDNIAANPLREFMTFWLGDFEYAVDLRFARQVLEAAPVTPIPRMPDFMVGLINLHSNTVPVIDLSRKLSVPRCPSDEDCFLIVRASVPGLSDREIPAENIPYPPPDQGEQVTAGFLVDQVKDILRIPEDELHPPPRFGSGVGKRFIRSAIRRKESFVIELDVMAILSYAEMSEIWTAWDTESLVTDPASIPAGRED